MLQLIEGRQGLNSQIYERKDDKSVVIKKIICLPHVRQIGLREHCALAMANELLKQGCTNHVARLLNAAWSDPLRIKENELPRHIFTYESEKGMVEVRNLYLTQARADLCLEEMFKKLHFFDDALALSLFFQGIQVIVALQSFWPGGLNHNDIYPRNVLLQKVDKNEVFAYKYPNQTFYCRSMGYQLQLCDFGLSTCKGMYEKIHEHGIVGNKYVPPFEKKRYHEIEHLLFYGTEVDQVQRDFASWCLSWLSYDTHSRYPCISPRMSLMIMHFLNNVLLTFKTKGSKSLESLINRIELFFQDGIELYWMPRIIRSTVPPEKTLNEKIRASILKLEAKHRLMHPSIKVPDHCPEVEDVWEIPQQCHVMTPVPVDNEQYTRVKVELQRIFDAIYV